MNADQNCCQKDTRIHLHTPFLFLYGGADKKHPVGISVLLIQYIISTFASTYSEVGRVAKNYTQVRVLLL